MIKFDKMKLVTSIDYVSEIQYDLFNINMRQDEVLYYKYELKSPFYLLIMINYSKNELVLEFTGKILLEHYPSLINKDTINECIDNINTLGVCKLDRDLIINNANVVKCDVTMDVEGDISMIIPSLRQNIVNYAKWNTKPYFKGIVLEKVVSTDRYKKRLSIYDKQKELRQKSPKYFLSSLSNENEVLDYFKDKVRFELNINTKPQVKQLLNIPDNNIQSVLNSTANPILSVIDEAVKYEQPRVVTYTLRDYEHELLLKDCDYDLEKVEAKVRVYSKKTTSITRAMQPYKILYKNLNFNSYTNIDLRKLVC